MTNPTRSVTTKSPFSQAEEAAIKVPLEQAQPLPPRAFDSMDLFELERERILYNNWTPIGFDYQVPNPGDVLPITLWEVPLLLVRGMDNKVRVFHNICPQDGFLLAQEPLQGATALTSLVHGWSFDLQGRRINDNTWDSSFIDTIDALGVVDGNLIELETHRFLHAVFVDLMGKASPFDEQIAVLHQLHADYELQEIKPCPDTMGLPRMRVLQQDANWKALAAGFGHAVLEDVFAATEAPVSMNHRAGAYIAAEYNALHLRSPFPASSTNHLGKGETPPVSAYIALCYPTFILCSHPEFLYAGILIPEAPGRTQLVSTCFFGTSVGSQPDLDEIEENLAQAFERASQSSAMEKIETIPSQAWSVQQHLFNIRVVDDLLNN